MFIGLLSVFTGGSAIDSLNSNSEEPIECVSLNNHSCQDIPTLVDINSDETLLYPFNVTINKGVEIVPLLMTHMVKFVTNKVKNINVKTLNLTSGVNETRFLFQHESSECKCRLNESVCKSKQKWNHNKCRCECKRLELL